MPPQFTIELQGHFALEMSPEPNRTKSSKFKTKQAGRPHQGPVPHVDRKAYNSEIAIVGERSRVSPDKTCKNKPVPKMQVPTR